MGYIKTSNNQMVVWGQVTNYSIMTATFQYNLFDKILTFQNLISSIY